MRTSTSLWYERMHRAHEEFRRSAAALHAALRSSATASGRAGTECVRREFESFARSLHRHFEEEEHADPFRPESAASAAARRWAERTLSAHRGFEVRLDEILRALEGATDETALEARLCALIDDLFEHELAEERLVQRLVFEESGGLDPAL